MTLFSGGMNTLARKKLVNIRVFVADNQKKVYLCIFQSINQK